MSIVALVLLFVWSASVSASELRSVDWDVSLEADPLRRSAECTYHSNKNITSPNLKEPTYVVSSFLCCQLCSETAGCMAAVYANYLCELKSETGPVESSVGGTIVHMEGITPQPTVAPETTTTTPVPIPPTTATPSANSVQLVRRMRCESSPDCNEASDNSCRTNAYVAGDCYSSGSSSHKFVCFPGYVVQFSYSDGTCSGTSTDSQSQTGSCYEDNAENYRETHCQTIELTANLPITRQSCQTEGSQCYSEFYYSGTCMATTNLHSGNTIMLYCGPTFVWYETYSSHDCSGPALSSVTQPTTLTYESGNSNYITWACNYTSTGRP